MIFIKHLRYTATILFIVFSFRLTAKTPLILTIYDGKAHYIIEVMKHITWPNEDEITNFNVVILGKDKNLLNALNNKANSIIRGKSISIQQLEHLNAITGNVEVIFVSKNKLSLIPEINKNYNNALIINDGNADKQDLMVGLFVGKKNIKLTLNRSNLIDHGFNISNGLLDFAGTKADLREQLKDRESTLNEALHDAKTKEVQLLELNWSLTENKEQLQKIQSNLVKQNNLLLKTQTEINSLKNSKEVIKLELANNINDLLAQQELFTKEKAEHEKQQQKLHQLKFDIEQNEEKLKQQINKLKQKSIIIKRKEQKISGQRKLLYITIAFALIILLLKFVVLRISNSRKKANKELANLNEKLYELATKDDMTKLFNRRHFLELTQRELSQQQRTKSMGFVLMIDIDHFKKVNDNYGHATGDQAIINVANILKDNLREYDIVGRVGGEEFSMFLPNCERDIATQIAERIRNKVANLSTAFRKTSIKLTISIGLTARKENESSIDSMLHRADKALYQAKDSGRNKVVLL